MLLFCVAPCTWAQASTTPNSATLPATTSAPNQVSTQGDASTAIKLVVSAPSPLDRLLRDNLDLARLAQLPAGDNLSELELRRVEAATPSQVRALLETEGYFSPRITMRRVQGEGTEVHVTVVPGVRTTVQHLLFDIQGDLERAAATGDIAARTTIAFLRDNWPLPIGAGFRNQRWNEGKTAVLAKLRAEGYAAANWSGTSAQVDADANAARLTLIADSGPLYRLGELKIEGLQVHDDATVRNLSGFSRGAPATEATLLDYQERLIRTGLYDVASVTLDMDNANADGTPVLVRVQEAPIQTATVGVGYSANTGPRVSLEHTHRRVFGYRATARNKLEIGRLRQAWEGELSSHAQPDLYRNLVGGAFERLEADDGRDVVRSARLRLGRTRETTREEHYTFVQLERADRTAWINTGTIYEGITAGSLNHHAIWRDVDNVLLPTQGYGLSLQSGAGFARSNSSQGPYGRLLVRGTYWKPLASFFTSARLELGQVFAKDDLAVPQTQLFRVGGDDSVRGYAYRSLGPATSGVVGGGRVMMTTSVEVARPVSESLPTVWWAVFADAGQAANRWQELKPVWGAGAGVRWRSPVGPLSIDWAWGQATRRGRLHLSVGIVF